MSKVLIESKCGNCGHKMWADETSTASSVVSREPHPDNPDSFIIREKTIPMVEYQQTDHLAVSLRCGAADKGFTTRKVSKTGKAAS